MNSVGRACVVLTGALLLSPLCAFAAPAAPFANTLPATYITEKSAKLSGSVNSNETTDTYQWFEWGISGRPEVYETTRSVVRSGTTLIATTATVQGLMPSTLYFYRQIAENSRGKVIGSTAYFTTKSLPTPDIPVISVETYDATLVKETSVTLNGYVSAHENAGATWWFEYGETTAFGQITPVRVASKIAGPVTAPVTRLVPGTTYYFRIVGENSEHTTGATKTFVTPGTRPASATAAADTKAELLRAQQIGEIQRQIIVLLLDLVTQLKNELAALKPA